MAILQHKDSNILHIIWLGLHAANIWFYRAYTLWVFGNCDLSKMHCMCSLMKLNVAYISITYILQGFELLRNFSVKTHVCWQKFKKDNISLELSRSPSSARLLHNTIASTGTISQRTHDAIITTSFWRQNDVVTLFWHHTDVIIASCGRWDSCEEEWCRGNVLGP